PRDRQPAAVLLLPGRALARVRLDRLCELARVEQPDDSRLRCIDSRDRRLRARRLAAAPAMDADRARAARDRCRRGHSRAARDQRAGGLRARGHAGRRAPLPLEGGMSVAVGQLPGVRVQRWTRTSAGFTTALGGLIAVFAFAPVLFGASTLNNLIQLYFLVLLAMMWNALAG